LPNGKPADRRNRARGTPQGPSTLRDSWASLFPQVIDALRESTASAWEKSADLNDCDTFVA
jgi:hypothetical protein